MHTETRTEAVREAVNETVNTVFQMVTIALVGLFTLTQTVQFLASAIA